MKPNGYLIHFKNNGYSTAIWFLVKTAKEKAKAVEADKFDAEFYYVQDEAEAKVNLTKKFPESIIEEIVLTYPEIAL